MNPTQLVCHLYSCKEPLPKVGGVEIRLHRIDGKVAYYFHSIECAKKYIDYLVTFI